MYVLLCELTGIFGVQGATIRRDEITGAVVVARIMRGGAADRSGELYPTSAFPAFFLSPCRLIKQIISACSQKTVYDHRQMDYEIEGSSAQKPPRLPPTPRQQVHMHNREQFSVLT